MERFDREALRGFVNPQAWLQPEGLELITPTGNAVVVPYREVKAVGFVRDLDAAVLAGEKREFTTRPKSEGLWVRLQFRDGDLIDGLLANNLLQLSEHGFTIVPPDSLSNNQRIFVPRAALAELKVLGVIGSPLKRRKRTPPPSEQIKLFE
ncbi:MAG: hypothetical protein KIT09_33385 [Bryobacteraceae bacterium]|nr:hypothetical protein [Bryobacteraceae bacterium]